MPTFCNVELRLFEGDPDFNITEKCQRIDLSQWYNFSFAADIIDA